MQEAVACRWHRVCLQLRMYFLRDMHGGDEKHLSKLPRRATEKATAKERVIGFFASPPEAWNRPTLAIAHNLVETKAGEIH